MRALYGRPVFRVGDEEYRWEDVVLAGVVRGEWGALVDDARRGLACAVRLQRAGATLPAAEVEPRAAAFRYERGLLAADDLRAWLARWGLGVDEWLGCMRRGVLRERWAAELDAIVAAHPVAHGDLAGALPAEAVCSGRLQGMARRLAARAAAGESMRQAATAAGGGAADLADALVRRLAAEPAGGVLEGLAPDALAAAVRRVALVETAMDGFRRALVSDAALGAQVTAHRLDWIRVEYTTLALPSEAAAREAALCVRDDGMRLEEVGAEAGLPTAREATWLEAHEEPLRGMLLGALAGELLGPLRGDRGYTLLQVRAKRPPSVEDPAVRERAESDLVQRALRHEVERRVRWTASL